MENFFSKKHLSNICNHLEGVIKSLYAQYKALISQLRAVQVKNSMSKKLLSNIKLEELY